MYSKNCILITVLLAILSGCASIVPGSTVDARLLKPLPQNMPLCVNPISTSPSELNANDKLRLALTEAGVKLECDSPHLKAFWSYSIGSGETELSSIPGASSGAGSCAGGVCSYAGSSTAPMMMSDTNYPRNFKFIIFTEDSNADYVEQHWTFEWSSKGSITNINNLMGVWSSIIVDFYGQNIANEFIPHKGLNFLMD